MRKTCYIFASLALAHAAQGQISTPAAVGQLDQGDVPGSTAPAIIERGPHHRVWERAVYETTRSGQMPRVHRYTELATGMHYQEASNGPWLDTVEEIEPFPGRRGRTQRPAQSNFRE